MLSTCSEYFEQMFERTSCRHPIIVLKDIRKEDLEALLNYMYVGEVNVLQNNLSGLIKAAEGLRIKGLAVPDESPVEESSQDAKRSIPWSSDGPDGKRRRSEEQSASPQKPVHASQDKGTQEKSPSGYREPFRILPRSRDSSRGSAVSPSPVPVAPSPETHQTPSTPLPEASPDLLHPATRDLPAPPQPVLSNDSANSSESAVPTEQEASLGVGVNSTEVCAKEELCYMLGVSLIIDGNCTVPYNKSLRRLEGHCTINNTFNIKKYSQLTVYAIHRGRKSSFILRMTYIK